MLRFTKTRATFVTGGPHTVTNWPQPKMKRQSFTKILQQAVFSRFEAHKSFYDESSKARKPRKVCSSHLAAKSYQKSARSSQRCIRRAPLFVVCNGRHAKISPPKGKATMALW
jgi:hypothetical protein